MGFIHLPVLLNETIDSLNIKPNGVYIDATAGFGGHSFEILKKLSNDGSLIMIDQDPDAISFLRKKFKNNKNCYIVNDNFGNIKEIFEKLVFKKVDGILFDVGVSSFQFDNKKRGFSYQDESAILDMRMSKKGLDVKEIINSYQEKELANILWKYSEERFSKNIAREIIKRRKIKPIKTVGELVSIVKSSIPAKFLRNSSIHPARKTFQALRIEVNNELEVLKKGFDDAFKILNPNGRLCIITFHSLEDRIVKRKMVSLTKGCICPSDFPICICKNKPKAVLINKKPIVAKKEELEENKRSRSAKLRILEKI